MKVDTGSAFAHVSARLDQLVRLLAMTATADKKQKEQISLLSRAGLDRHEIAEILGTTAGTVSVELSVMKRGSRRKERRT
jgi:DNA-directed RNA polymerase specialized sigma24 family protein